LHGLQPGDDLVFGDREVHALIIFCLLLKILFLLRGVNKPNNSQRLNHHRPKLNFLSATSSSYMSQKN